MRNRYLEQQIYFWITARPVCPPAAWSPAADVYRVRDGWLVKFELAGVRPGDIEVHIRGRSLSVSGMRRDDCVAGCQGPLVMEIAYDRFERSVELPEVIEGAELETRYQDGMLLLKVTRGQR